MIHAIRKTNNYIFTYQNNIFLIGFIQMKIENNKSTVLIVIKTINKHSITSEFFVSLQLIN